MDDKEFLKKNEELAEKVLKPIMKIIDEYFFIIFENIYGEKGLMIPNLEEILNLEKVKKELKKKIDFIDSSACIIEAFGGDSLRISQKYTDMLNLICPILVVVNARKKQVENALENERKKQEKDEFLKLFGE